MIDFIYSFQPFFMAMGFLAGVALAELTGLNERYAYVVEDNNDEG